MPKFPRRWRLLAGLGTLGILTLYWVGSDTPEEPDGRKSGGGEHRLPLPSRRRRGRWSLRNARGPGGPGNPEGRTIALNILVVPAAEQGGEPDPVFFLAGGPGQAATELAPLLRRAVPDLFLRRDFVFVDQRGTGNLQSADLRLPRGAGHLLRQRSRRVVGSGLEGVPRLAGCGPRSTTRRPSPWTISKKCGWLSATDQSMSGAAPTAPARPPSSSGATRRASAR